MDIHGKSGDLDMDMDGKFHIHGKLGHYVCCSTRCCCWECL